MTVNGHTWVADPKTHLYTTTADLAQEWQTYYSEMQAGRGAELNDVQRLAGNAQAVFENTDLKFQPEAQLSVDRQDVQKVLDAVYAAMIGAGVDPSSTLTEDQYLAIGAVLQNNPTLRELAVQGHGLNNAWIPRYAASPDTSRTTSTGRPATSAPASTAASEPSPTFSMTTSSLTCRSRPSFTMASCGS